MFKKEVVKAEESIKAIESLHKSILRRRDRQREKERQISFNRSHLSILKKNLSETDNRKLL